MTRLPIITPDQFSSRQEQVFDAITNGKRGSIADLTDNSGGLIGPFNAMLMNPQIGDHLVSLGETMRFGTSLDRRIVELVTIIVGAHWRSNFEWWIHSRLAESAGIPTGCIEAIRLGAGPDLDDANDIAIYNFSIELLQDGRVASETYEIAKGFVGEHGLVEIVVLVGYYCTISFILNAFMVDVPAGVDPMWP